MIVNKKIPDFVFGMVRTKSVITMLNGSSNAGTGSMGLVLHSDLVYHPFDTNDKFSQNLSHSFSTSANINAGF